jgi:hypothetical protein
MTITYPLTIPSSPVPNSQRISMEFAVGSQASPFSYKAQKQDFGGDRWMMEIQYPTMSRPQAAEFQAFLLSLRGKLGTFLMGDQDALSPRGTGTGTPLAASSGSPSVNLAGDAVFYTDGWTPGVSGILLKGDYLQVGTGATSHLHMIMADAASDGGGLSTLDIQPNLRADVTDGAALVVNSPVGLWQMSANNPGWDSDAAIRYGFAFACEEAL